MAITAFSCHPNGCQDLTNQSVQKIQQIPEIKLVNLKIPTTKHQKNPTNLAHKKKKKKTKPKFCSHKHEKKKTQTTPAETDGCVHGGSVTDEALDRLIVAGDRLRLAGGE